MIISNSNVGMSASSMNQQTYTEQTKIIDPSFTFVSTTTSTRLKLQNSSHIMRSGKHADSRAVEYNGRPLKRGSTNQQGNNVNNEPGVAVKISDQGKKLAKEISSHSRAEGIGNSEKSGFGVFTDFRYRLLDSMLKLLTGGKSDLRSINPFLSINQDGLRNLKDQIERIRNPQGIVQGQEMPATMLAPNQSVQLNFRKIEMTTEFFEEQNVNFHAAGTVKTADGRDISIDVNLAMSSQFYSSNSVTITQTLKDPLVINFGSEPVSLTQNKFDFDIDCDGKADQISFATGSSGFLVIDEGDGVIRDGSQLFGATTGDGFAELAQHDQDRNGWVDEADDIYNKLRIWLKDESGNDRLMTLGEAGIGAIYLGNVATDYNLRADNGALDGQIRSTGIFLYENGSAGTIHHVDIAV